MPSKSAKEARTMAAAAHDPAFAAKKGIPVAVAKEFNQADKGTGIIHPKTDHNGHRVTTKSRGARGSGR